tara:strand:- start:24 stop:527 length:504 start_codon:yes stop_codon:yes gene_type:complete
VKKQPSYIIKKFSNLIEKNFLEQIFLINQENIPEVGSLSSITELKNLIKLSSINYYVIFENKVIGFMICFRERSDYKSMNYKFFCKKETKFLYIDRIAIKNEYRRKGIGKSLYKKLDSIANDKNLPLCCEVNTEPLNDVSIRFHKDFGFYEVGEYNFKDHRVAYFKK